MIAILSNTDNLVRIVKGYSGLGETGESYLAQRTEGGDAMFIVPLRFDDKAALQRVIPKEAQ